MSRSILLIFALVFVTANAMAQVYMSRDYSGRVLLLSSTVETAQDPLTQQRRGYLKGMGTITVRVDQYKGEDEQARQLKTEVELRLRQAGIKVGPGSTFLMLGRSHYPHGLCHIQAEIQEFGKFDRRQGVSELPAITWKSSLDGATQEIKADDWESTRKVLVAAVDEFVNDYLAANQTEEK
jgi:hypothetical protein